MNEWKNIIIDKLNKGIDIAQDILVGKYHQICRWYAEYDNKKGLAGAVTSWVVAFVVIIFICRLSAVSNVPVAANETTREEIESTDEKLMTEKAVLKETTRKAEETTVSEQLQETDTSVVEEITTEVQEKETIDISKINVSSTPIADDRDRGNNFTSISSADVKTISSTKYDSSQFSYGIDVSYHQGKIDWSKVKAAGVDYAFIRVGNRGYETGKLCKDMRFDENVRGALANDIQVGVYFFSQATTEAEAIEEASLTLNWIKNYNITLPVVVDWETDRGYRTYSGLSRSGLTNILTTFCDTVSRYGYEPMVYMCKDDFVNRINTSVITSRYKTWVAWYFKEYRSSNYSNNIFRYGNLLPDMTFDYNVWQYSDRGHVEGIKEPVDMNVMILPKKVYEVKLDNTKNTFVTNIGKSIDLMEGVTATDSSGNSAESSVSMNIYNSKGSKVSMEKAFLVSGEYKISYYFKDVNGTELNREAVLYVRNVPDMYFENVKWGEKEIKSIEYTYNEDISSEENYNEIISLIRDKCSSYYYDTVEGKSEKHKISNIDIQGMEQIMTDNSIEEKKVIISYTAGDGLGLESIRKCNVVIKREANIEETTEETTDNENTDDVTVIPEETTAKDKVKSKDKVS